MGDARAGDHRRIAQDYRGALQPLDQGDPDAQHHRDEVDAQPVEQAGD